SIVPYGSTGLDDCTFGVACARGVSVLNGGTAPFAWTASGLPPGMTVHFGSSNTLWWIAPNDAELWGRPTATGTYNVQLTVTDANGKSATNTFPLKVSALLQTNTLLNGALGAPYASTVRVIGGTGPYTVARTGGSLPAGLTLNSGTLVLNGTATESGFFSPQLTFTDAASHTVSFANYF